MRLLRLRNPPPNKLWTGPDVFNRARWNFWKVRLGELAYAGELREESKEWAKLAVEAMEKVERNDA